MAAAGAHGDENDLRLTRGCYQSTPYRIDSPSYLPSSPSGGYETSLTLVPALTALRATTDPQSEYITYARLSFRSLSISGGFASNDSHAYRDTSPHSHSVRDVWFTGRTEPTTLLRRVPASYPSPPYASAVTTLNDHSELVLDISLRGILRIDYHSTCRKHPPPPLNCLLETPPSPSPALLRIIAPGGSRS